MRVLGLDEIRDVLIYREVIDRMRDALIAHSRGECDTPMPMHLDITAALAEVHIKASYRQGGLHFALKIASTFPGNLGRGLSTSNGMMLLSSAETGDPVAFLADSGHLTDVRTAAVAAMAARELGRDDTVLGILGTGVQARLQAWMHAEVLPLEQIVIWGRTPERVEACRHDLQAGGGSGERRVSGRGGAPRPADRHHDGLPPPAAAGRRPSAGNSHLRGRRGFSRQAGARSRNPPPRRAGAGGFAPPV